MSQWYTPVHVQYLTYKHIETSSTLEGITPASSAVFDHPSFIWHDQVGIRAINIRFVNIFRYPAVAYFRKTAFDSWCSDERATPTSAVQDPHQRAFV